MDSTRTTGGQSHQIGRRFCSETKGVNGERGVDSNARSYFRTPPAGCTSGDFFVSHHRSIRSLRGSGSAEPRICLSASTPRRKRPYLFRRFFVCECAEHGIPMATVMEWLGHDEMKMVTYHHSLRDQTARDTMRMFPADATAPRLSHRRIEQRAARTARRRTSSNALEHSGSGHEKTASPQRKRGLSERGGFEPPVQV
jgi:integrase